MKSLNTKLLHALTFATAVALAGCSGMGMMPANTNTSFNAVLTGAAEVPPTPTAGAGTLDANLDRSTGLLRWKLTYSGLTGAATMAHFHGPALPGSNAGVVVPFANAASPSEGQATLTPAQVTDLTAGKWYVNVHTAAHPAGEIRGQMMVK